MTETQPTCCVEAPGQQGGAQAEGLAAKVGYSALWQLGAVLRSHSPQMWAHNHLHSPDHSLQVPEGPSPFSLGISSMTYSRSLSLFPPLGKNMLSPVLSRISSLWTTCNHIQGEKDKEEQRMPPSASSGSIWSDTQCHPKRLDAN